MINALQKLVPRRPLNLDEALAIAEKQAHRLRRQIGVSGPAISDHQLKSIPGVIVESVANLSVSGATRKIGGIWIVLTDRSEAPVRQRFTIAHEIKHILDDRAFRNPRRSSVQTHQPGWRAERICDYFAACLLMPRMWIKRAWTTGIQTEPALAELFNVSTTAIRLRLQQIGLVDHTPCWPGNTPNVVPLGTTV